MKNKLDYEAAKWRLKGEEHMMRTYKNNLRWSRTVWDQQNMQRKIKEKRDTINLLLSVIHAHKVARRLYGKRIQRRQLEEAIDDMAEKRGFNSGRFLTGVCEKLGIEK